MKVLFLDIDGVLNFRMFEGLKRQIAMPDPIEQPDMYAAFRALAIDEELVLHLNKIVLSTGASVVVSSAWRIGHTIEQLGAILRHAGFEGIVIGKTDSWGKERGDEIMRWVETGVNLYGMKIESFAILDDDDDMGMLLPYLVNTSFETGITDADADECIKLLNSDPLAIIGV